MAETRVENRLAEVRQRRGVSAADLARRVGISRQTVYAIEAGTYVPNTEVALNLARELEVRVEELFTLREEAVAPHNLPADVLSAAPPVERQAVRICRVGERWVGVPVSATPLYMPEADGVVVRASRTRGRAELTVFAKEDPEAGRRLVMAGCDPATGILARMVERTGTAEIVPAAASSKLALTWLKEGKVHIAGSHLEDPKTGEFNLPYVHKLFPEGGILVFTFARWEEGLVVAPANPKAIQQVEDLARKNVRFVNREAGSGSRALVDQRLAKAGIETAQVHGYEREAPGHLAAAYCVLSGEADVCIATRSAARAFGLDFIPLHSERYDLVLRQETAATPAAKAFLDVLQRAALRRQLEVLAGYDTSATGSALVS